MNRKFTILVMITTIVLLIFIIGGLAKPEYHVNEKKEFTIEAENECTGEWISFSGTLHYKSQLVIDSAGGVHYTGFQRLHLVGIGQISGIEYIANVTNNWQWNDKEFPLEANDIATNILISKGKETNLTMQWREHITINANGEVTVDFDELKIKCTGE